MQTKIIRFIHILQSNWKRADISSKAAEMAYYALLSLLPLMLVFVNVIPLLPIPQKEVLGYVSTVLPANVYTVIQPVLIDYLNSSSGGVISIGAITALWSASAILIVLKQVLDRIYGIESEENFIVSRLLSLLLMIGVGAALAAVVFTVVFGQQVLSFAEETIGIQLPVIEEIISFRWFLLVLVLFLFFLLIYQVIPNHHLTLKYALPGAGFSTIGWLVLSQAFSLYIKLAGGTAVTNTTFGGFIVLMLFLYISGMITFLGALINTLYFEWVNKESVGEYNRKIQRKKELEQEGTTEYPKEDTVLLRRKIVKVKKLNTEEIEKRTKDQKNTIK